MLIIENGSAVTPEGVLRTNIAVAQGKIAAIGGDLRPGPGDSSIDASGSFVLPGFIDAHTHLDMGEGELRTADDFASGSRAALRGGTTTIIDFATQQKGGTLREALAVWKSKAGGLCSCDYGFHMAITDWNAAVRAEIPDIVRAGVSSFKLYMAYDALRVDDAALLDALLTLRESGALAGVHCENGELVNFLSRRLLSAGETSPAAHPRSRPPEAEAEAVNRLLYLARLADTPVHIVHLSSRLALEEVRRARLSGQTVYAETCPQYLLLDESRYQLPGFESAKYVLSPPLRPSEDVVALGDALAAGELDSVATDHCSFRFDGQKTLGRDDFTRIPSGIPGIEHRAALLYTHFAANGRITMSRFAELMSENPARLFGMYPRKGVIAPGADADLVVWNPEAVSTIRAAEQYQNTDYTPYEGMEVSGRADVVLLGGEAVVREGNVVRENAGRYVPRRPAEK